MRADILKLRSLEGRNTCVRYVRDRFEVRSKAMRTFPTREECNDNILHAPSSNIQLLVCMYKCNVIYITVSETKLITLEHQPIIVMFNKQFYYRYFPSLLISLPPCRKQLYPSRVQLYHLLNHPDLHCCNCQPC